MGDQRAALDTRGFRWRSEPRRDATPEQADRLATAPDADLPALVLQLVDNEQVTQSSIATALGVTQAALSTRLASYRQDGTWPAFRRRAAAPARPVTSQETEQLRSTPPVQLGALVVEFLDAGVTALSIARALGIPGRHLRSRVERYRQTGTWTEVAAPRILTAAEADELRSLVGPALADRVVELLDAERVMRSSIGEVLGINAQTVTARVDAYRRTGTWSTKTVGRRIADVEVAELQTAKGTAQAEVVVQLLAAGVSASGIGRAMGTDGQTLAARAATYRKSGQWRTQTAAPRRTPAEDEIRRLRALEGMEQAALVLAMIEDGVTQGAIAEVLGVTRPAVVAALKTHRSHGRWPRFRTSRPEPSPIPSPRSPISTGTAVEASSRPKRKWGTEEEKAAIGDAVVAAVAGGATLPEARRAAGFGDGTWGRFVNSVPGLASRLAEARETARADQAESTRKSLTKREAERAQVRNARRAKLEELLPLLEEGLTLAQAQQRLGLSASWIDVTYRMLPDTPRLTRAAFAVGRAKRPSRKPTAGDAVSERDAQARTVVVTAIAQGRTLRQAAAELRTTATWIVGQCNQHSEFHRALLATAELHGYDIETDLEAARTGTAGWAPAPRMPAPREGGVPPKE